MVIRKIPAESLTPGMYVVDLHRSWFEHSLWRRRLLIRDQAVVQRLLADGVTEVSIDVRRGADVPVSPEANLAGRRGWSPANRIRGGGTVSLGEERRRAGRLLHQATAQVGDLILAARAGRLVDCRKLEPLVGKMIESVARNPDGLVPLARLKPIHAYATYHAVASTALVIAFAHRQGQQQAEIEKLALGTLVKDIGQVVLDARIVVKPGKLSSDERSLMHSHVKESLVVLNAANRLSETTKAVVREHHERYDGSGYPCHLAGQDISAAGRMAAIVDTYDAMTSDRPYRRARSPASALRQMYQKAGTLFDPTLVAGFVHTVGVYPVGTLVRLESGHLAVVDEVHRDDLLHPVVRVIFHAERRHYVTPVRVDLSRRYGNHFGQIIRAEEFESWGINSLRWQPV